MSQLRVTSHECGNAIKFKYNGASRAKCYGDAGGDWGLDYESTATFGRNGAAFPWAGANVSLLASSVEDGRDSIMTARRTRWANFLPSGAYPVILPNSGKAEAQ